MLFKLSVNNIRKSLRDYAIYFFTLIIGVSVFYVFNAIGGQTAMLKIDGDTRDIAEVLRTVLSGVSIFVAGVLGLLIVYASRFLMKRRSKEFALYLMLGMSKSKISALLLTETIIIGIGSLGVGLLIGIGVSQLTSALVADLFEADMTAYKFTICKEAIIYTIICFAIVYLVVMIFNSIVISRFKLIDLLQSGRKSEQTKLKNPVLCVIVFILSAVMLGYAYYQAGWKLADNFEEGRLAVYIAMGAVSTFLIFWSVSGMLLKIIMSMKKIYFKELNSFTFRQISSKVNTMVFSMTVICLMLFVTICALSGSFSIRNSLNQNLKKLCPADVDFVENTVAPCGTDIDVLEDFKLCDVDIDSYLSEYVVIRTYMDENFTFYDFAESASSQVTDYMQEMISVSDYNHLMELYGKESVTLNDNEYILLCNFQTAKEIQNKSLAKHKTITIWGNTLSPKYDSCLDGFIEISANPVNYGIFIVPDSVIDENAVVSEKLIGNYAAETKQEKSALETEFRKQYDEKIRPNLHLLSYMKSNSGYCRLDTKLDIANAAIGLGAISTFLGLYLGLVFLIACGAILALKELSESVDSIPRYEMIRKIGVDENDISKSLFQQTGIFFLLPLILACIHSVFGMKFASIFLEMFGTEKTAESIAATSIIILLIYGGYFLITYYCSKGIIKEKR